MPEITVGVTGKDKDGKEFNEVFIVNNSSISGLRASQDFQDNMKAISEKYGTDKLEFFASKN